LGNETVELITSAGGAATFIRLDAVSPADNAAMAECAVDTDGSLDVLVTAAGISHSGYTSGDMEVEVKWVMERAEMADKPYRGLLDLELEDFRQVMAINVDGTLLAVQACAGPMIDAGNGGSVITIASIAAKNPDAGPLPYVASKSAIWMMTKKLARILAGEKIRVNAIGPGYIETHMTEIVNLFPEDRQAEYYATIPMGRRGVPEEIANTALFLASEESSYFTGEILHSDGGYFTG
ncbi:MAG: SDR family oxidoreductase, partial [Actinomycetota bacterium]|nr:SDR family oxidoreductase [Actinomycetota bacterium]